MRRTLPAPAASGVQGRTATSTFAASIPGSLVAPRKCRKLSGSGFVRTRSIAGVGKLRSNATSKPGTPLKLTVVGGRPGSVSWTLDGGPRRARRAA